MARALALISRGYWTRHYRQLLIISLTTVFFGAVIGVMFYRLGGLFDAQSPNADWVLRLVLASASLVGFWQVGRYPKTKSTTLIGNILIEERFYQYLAGNLVSIALGGIIILGGFYLGLSDGWLTTPLRSEMLTSIALLTAGCYGIGAALAVTVAKLTQSRLFQVTFNVVLVGLLTWLFGWHNSILWQRLHFQLIEPSISTLIIQLVTATAVLVSSITLIEYQLQSFLLQTVSQTPYLTIQNFHRALNQTVNAEWAAWQVALIRLVRSKQTYWRLSQLILALAVIMSLSTNGLSQYNLGWFLSGKILIIFGYSAIMVTIWAKSSNQGKIT